MSAPALHLLAGPNGAGKTTFVERVLKPVTHLRFVNADRIAAEGTRSRSRRSVSAMNDCGRS